MRLQFLGADRTVTGSCHLFEANGVKVLLDMGLYQGPRQRAREFNQWVSDAMASADAVILSHGHLDHCGKLPVLGLAGYKNPIYCTAATASVARIVLEDSGEIQEEDADYLNRRARQPGEPAVQPLYRRSDVPAILRLMRHVEYGKKTPLGPDVWFTLFDAGHILGSAYVVLEWKENGAVRSLMFTADLGRRNSPILRDPQPLAQAHDYVITESTYGDRPHASMDEVAPQLLDAVRWCIEKRSRLVVPAFAVGRTQVILWYIQKFIREKAIKPLPIYVDSPMGVQISEIHARYPALYDQETTLASAGRGLFGGSPVTFTISMQDSKKINSDPGPCVIIASSPTCEFGRILHHLKQTVERADDVIVFVGWTPPRTLGRRIQDGEKRVRIFDRWYDMRCQVRTIHGLSAHADGQEIMDFLVPAIRPASSVFVVHGEPESAETLGQKLLAAGAGRVAVPGMETVVLSAENGTNGEARNGNG